MKKILIVSLAACFIITGMLIAVPRPLQSATLGIGAAGWYTWWDPRPEYADAEADPSIMYGPQLVIGFSPTVTLSSVFLYGKFKYYQTGYESTIERYDSDTTLSYKLNQYMRIFGGLKYMGYKWEEGSHLGLGPGFGMGFTVPLNENLYCVLSISGMYLWTEQKEEDYTGGNISTDYITYGINNSLSLVYMVPSSSVSLSIGGRYFYFHLTPERIFQNHDKENHHFYGVTASAMYMINL